MRTHPSVILATIPPSEYCQSADPSLLPSAANPYAGNINPGPENPAAIPLGAILGQ